MGKDHVVTATVGRNEKVLPGILKLYVPDGGLVADVTYGRGNFWRRVPEGKYRLVSSDLHHGYGMVNQDFQALAYANESLDALVLDPPYLYIGGWKTLRSDLDGTYRNKERAAGGVSGVEAVDEMYRIGMDEAWRVLKPGGVLILKCQDQIMSGKQQWAHITYHNMGADIGFYNLDLFVVILPNTPLFRHPPEQQKHARRNHSYFLVFRKPTRRQLNARNVQRVGGVSRPVVEEPYRPQPTPAGDSDREGRPRAPRRRLPPGVALLRWNRGLAPGSQDGGMARRPAGMDRQLAMPALLEFGAADGGVR